MIEEKDRPILEKALYFLGRREYSHHELRGKLCLIGSAESVKRVLRYLEKKEWLSNTRFATMVASHYARKGYGPLWIRAYLKYHHCIDIQTVIDLEHFCDWEQWARKQRAKKYGVTCPVDLQAKRRQQAYLQRRGYTADQIHQSLLEYEEGS